MWCVCTYLPCKAQNHQLVVEIGLSALRDLKIMLWWPARVANIMMRMMPLMMMEVIMMMMVMKMKVIMTMMLMMMIMIMMLMLMMMKVIMMGLKVSPVLAKSRCTRGCPCIFPLSLSENQILTIKYYILIYLHSCLNFRNLVRSSNDFWPFANFFLVF